MNTSSWQKIDTLLLDMDGTLLDLSFDNWFWQQHFPAAYAQHYQLTPPAAQAAIDRIMARSAGTLAWYSLDFWHQETGLDVVAIKRAVGDRIGYRQHAEQFLQRLQTSGKRVILTTNAHPDTLRIKIERTGIDRYFDALVSSHDYGAAKEHPDFWTALEDHHHISPATCLLLDDSLPVLRAAKAYGIGFPLSIRQPDSTKPPRADNGFPMVDNLLDLLP